MTTNVYRCLNKNNTNFIYNNAPLLTKIHLYRINFYTVLYWFGNDYISPME